MTDVDAAARARLLRRQSGQRIVAVAPVKEPKPAKSTPRPVSRPHTPSTAPVEVHGRKVEMVALDALQAFAGNARTHPEAQIEALVAVIRDSGFTTPLIVDEANVIIAGHGRAEAARRVGMAEVPCVRVSGLTDAQVRALRLSDNQIALLSEWDFGTLGSEIKALTLEGFDLKLTGFTDAEFGRVFLDPGASNDPGAAWGGMPSFEQEDKGAHQSITVHLADPAAVMEFAALIGQKITDKTRSVWFPKAEIETYVDKEYRAEE